MKGTVLKSTGKWYELKLENGATVEARLKGKIRLEGIKSTNPVSVGDKVQVEAQQDETYLITKIQPRKNVLVRKAANLSKQTHVIAANIDRLFVMFTLSNPKTTHTFLDRILVMAEAFDVPSSIIFNKIDTYSEEELEEINLLRFAYKQIGYESYAVSAKTGEGIEKLKADLAKGVNAITGHSGVGKSTLINYLDPALGLKMGSISDVNKVGKHTTTFAQMHELSFGGYFIDSPGVKGFGMVELEKEELALYFPEMKALLGQCKFYNCRHLNEPGCAVKEALEKGEIPPWRYNSYLNMLEEDESNPHRTVNYT